MHINHLFNPQGNDPDPQIFEGNTTGMCQLNNVSRPWAYKLYKQMRENVWIPEKFDMSQDVNDYWNLIDDERNAYDTILSFLIFLDSVQVNNILYIKRPISAPEIGLCLVEQASEEGLHSDSYQYIIQSILEKNSRDFAYERWRKDPILKERCEVIAETYQSYIDDGSLQSYLKALMADYILEGLYFYCGFMFFYNLASRSLMPGTADIIRMIHRDELTHVKLYQNLIIEAKNQYPQEDWGSLEKMLIDAIPYEIKWNNHVCIDNSIILGITQQASTEYVNYLVATRLKAVGFNADPSKFNNPYQHLERFADLENKGNNKTNFFEGAPAYKLNPQSEGWDDF
jgi:ribonucleoside-diphosphate reductase beta chain